MNQTFIIFAEKYLDFLSEIIWRLIEKIPHFWYDVSLWKRNTYVILSGGRYDQITWTEIWLNHFYQR